MTSAHAQEPAGKRWAGGGHVHEIDFSEGFAQRRRAQIQRWNIELEARRSEIEAARSLGGVRARGRRAVDPGDTAETEGAVMCRLCGARVILLPHTSTVPIVRTDFSDAGRWETVIAVVRQSTAEGFQANVEPVDDPEFQDLTALQLLDRLPVNTPHRVLFVVDSSTISDRDHPVLALDLYDEPGRSLRVRPSAVQSVENNVTFANMGFAEYANAVDADGVFRGF